MRILFLNNTESQSQAVVIIGIGLVGNGIFENLQNKVHANCFDCSLDWSCKENVVKTIQTEVLKRIDVSVTKIDWIWSAGKVGFSATEEEAKVELVFFRYCIEHLKKIQENFVNATHVFHLVSSAGGLFEGMRVTSTDMIPAPKRPYGMLKLEQEKIAGQFFVTNIYRLSTVYGYFKKNFRIGLVAALIKNNIYNKITVLDNPQTLRDYVWIEDVANFITQQVLIQENIPQKNTVFFLVSGKPTAIFEIVNLLQHIANNKIMQRYKFKNDNSQSILFPRSLQPEMMTYTSLEVCVRNIYKKALSQI